jgi:hypothetical protein
MEVLQTFRIPAYLSSALRYWSFAIRHSSLIPDVESHSQNVSGASIGPENA